MSINHLPVTVDKYDSLLSKFAIEYRTKLQLYTCEELYYVYRVMMHKPRITQHGDYYSGDVFVLSLRAKLVRWLKGEVQFAIAPMAWDKLGFKYKADYLTWYVTPLPRRMGSPLSATEKEMFK